MTTITAVITCFHEGELIYNALESLYSQTDRDFDIMLVNDCSSDADTNRVCKEIELKKKAFVIWKEINQGHGCSMNNAFEKMITDVAVFLDADDTLPSEAIKNIRKTFNKNCDAEFVFGNYKVNYIEKNTTEIVDCSVLANEEGRLSPEYLANDWKLLGTSPCKKSLWQKIKGYSFEIQKQQMMLIFTNVHY